jgi:hypothetical protein
MMRYGPVQCKHEHVMTTYYIDRSLITSIRDRISFVRPY